METILETKNLTKIFNPDTRAQVAAVSDVNLKLGKGEILMIMGPSGSGKTTLLTMLGGLLGATKGEIIFGDQKLNELNARELAAVRREKLGFIFQSFNLLENLSALENVIIAIFKNHSRSERAKALLIKLGLKDRIFSKPKELSGGERQRVAIARALINDPLLILADEPTANLDSAIGREVMKLLCSIGCEQGKSVIVVSHDERIKDIAHRVVYIEDGKLARQGKGRHTEVCLMKDHFFKPNNAI